MYVYLLVYHLCQRFAQPFCLNRPGMGSGKTKEETLELMGEVWRFISMS